MKFLWVFILILVFSCVGFPLVRRNKTSKDINIIRLDSEKPSAYISFVKFGKREPYKNDESGEGIWLQFHNNSKWNLFIKTLDCVKERECFIPYQVRKRDLSNTVGHEINSKELTISNSNLDDNSKIPSGYDAHQHHIRKIKSGDSVIFSIPREHLNEQLYILVGFGYEWEQGGEIGGGFLNIIHEATFLSTDLPKKIK